jgi:dihydroorotate dehydrogenase
MLYKIFKYFLNLIDPEIAHKLAIKIIKNPFIKFNFSDNKSHLNLIQNIFDIKFKNPIGLAAGFDKNAEIYNQIFKLGFSYSEIGTVTPQPQEGNIKPRVFRLEEDKAIINRLGFPNYGMEIIKERMIQDKPKGICGANIGPNKENATLIDDYLLCFDNLYDIASYITINISSPNTPNLRLQHEQDNIKKLVDAILKRRNQKKSKVPILFKISPDIDDSKIKNLCEIFLEKNIDGVILTNTSIKNKNSLLSRNKDQDGGISGDPIYNLSNKIIEKFYLQLGKNIPIIGVGGVKDGKTAYEKIKSGASLLQLYTSFVYEGPLVANKINKELSDLVKKDGYENISQAIGINCK